MPTAQPEHTPRRTLSDGRDAVAARVNLGARLELERFARQAHPVDPVTLLWRRLDALEARCELWEAAFYQLAMLTDESNSAGRDAA